MTRDDVWQRMERFYECLAEEKALRAELNELRFTGVDEAKARESMSRQRQVLKQIEELHTTQMLPIVNEMAEFVSKKLKALPQPKKEKAAPTKPTASR